MNKPEYGLIKYTLANSTNNQRNDWHLASMYLCEMACLALSKTQLETKRNLAVKFGKRGGDGAKFWDRTIKDYADIETAANHLFEEMQK